MKSLTQHIGFFMLLALLQVSCSKGLLDQDLNYNPFDPEYAGESPFSLVSATPVTEIVLGQPVQKIRVRFAMDESVFTGQPPFYQVSVWSDWDGSDAQIRPSSEFSSNGYFEYLYEHPHVSSCVYVALHFSNSAGKRYELCFEL